MTLFKLRYFILIDLVELGVRSGEVTHAAWALRSSKQRLQAEQNWQVPHVKDWRDWMRVQGADCACMPLRTSASIAYLAYRACPPCLQQSMEQDQRETGVHQLVAQIGCMRATKGCRGGAAEHRKHGMSVGTGGRMPALLWMNVDVCTEACVMHSVHTRVTAAYAAAQEDGAHAGSMLATAECMGNLAADAGTCILRASQLHTALAAHI